MSYPINYPTPQGANIQIFNAGETKGTQTWVKPQGASFVWFTLIGAGSSGDASNYGGSSGAVTNCMVPAFLIPDSLQIDVGKGGIGVSQAILVAGTNTLVNYTVNGSYNLLTANGGGTTGGAASTSNYFSCMGFYQSVAGQTGSNASVNPSSTTFLSGGGGGSSTSNYGYITGNSTDGFFQLQPIIVGVGGGGNLDKIKTGIGCGGAFGLNFGGAGGNGLVVIITW
jgi:hypothetical protein